MTMNANGFGKKSRVTADRLNKAARGSFTPEGLEQVVTDARNATRGRKATFRQGRLRISAQETVPVVVKNVSKRGARVEFFNKVRLPDTVTLIEPSLQINTRMYVAWQENGSAGLTYAR
ncbi:MAG: hypothetical protein R3C52_00845 [Hyphomonadaceae bacterium]